MLLASLLALACPAAGHVYVVDSTGAGDFLSLQVAVDFAQDGDTLVVRPMPGNATYAEAVVHDKDLRILSEWGTAASVGRLVVRDLAPDRQVLVAGLRFGDTGWLQGEHCSGSLRLLECDGGLRLTGCADVVLTDSRMSRRSRVVGSQLAVYDSELHGMHPGGHGDDALVAEASLVWLAGVVVRGGNGSDACGSGPCYDGGDGLVATAGTVVWAVETAFEGGTPGFCGPGLGCENESGEPGTPLVVDATSAVRYPEGARRGVELVPVVGREGHVVLQVRGAPGDRVALLRAPRGRWRLDLDRGGVEHVAPDAGSAPDDHGSDTSIPSRWDGVVPDDGTLWLECAPPAPGEHVQLVCLDTAGRLHLGDLFQMAEPPADTDESGLRRVFVDAAAPPGGDGRSWASAFPSLTDAADAIHATRALCFRGRTEVWIARGTYAPAPPGGDRSLRFSFLGPVHLLGGFAGDEALREERDPARHVTTLSGDLNGDDLPDGSGRDDNSRGLLTVWPGADAFGFRPDSSVDGLVVTGAESQTYQSHAPFEVGGGVVSRCVVRGNRCPQTGSILETEGWLLDCVLADNQAMDAALWMATCGAVQRCAFVGNATEGSGGARLSIEVPARVVGCVFAGNQGTWTGGLRLAQRAATQIVGCTFFANRSTSAGSAAGLLLTEDGATTVTGCVLWGNATSGIVDEASQLSSEYGSIALRYSCVQGLTTLDGPGCHRRDPSFVDPLGADGIPGTADDDLRLADGSPCIDAGDNAHGGEDLLDLDGDGERGEPVPLDLAGAPRRVDDPGAQDVGNGPPPLVDMGAYERQR